MPRLRPAAPRSKARGNPRLVTGIIAIMALAAVTTPLTAQGGKTHVKVTASEYEGWRQYNANCARCHGQDALPNPVAANLLESLAPDGPMHDEKAFTAVVSDGRVARGMPPFAKLLDSTQVGAVYDYLTGRAGKRIPPGRPEKPS